MPQDPPDNESDLNRLVFGRLVFIKEQLEKNDLYGILITSPDNRRYYSGFLAKDPMINESSGCLFITQKNNYLFTDSRYTLAASNEAELFEVIDIAKGLGSILSNLTSEKSKPDESNPEKSKIAFEPDFFTVRTYLKLLKELDNLELVASPFDTSLPRCVKSPSEIELIAKALDITEQAIALLWRELKPGWTEERAAWFLDSRFRELGAQGPAFETIVAAGPRAALPHAVPGPTKIEDGQMVVIDCGAQYHGYASDISRTFICGEAQSWQKEIYSTVKKAQALAIDAICEGKICSEIDRIARDYIADAGYKEFFGHGLGHGVGLAVHEAPRLSGRSSDKLLAGSVVTVEPGIYLPGRGGVRLEQLVLVTRQGHRVLNNDRHFYDFQ
ncbi:MAG: aminopeptidase P family protein [Deltaproteobacteria bacterium]|jgi:Xaa-Pro aminopeptidase|nr:aminopeptidase P family protein [Deltaproteobacteria bacterium]